MECTLSSKATFKFPTEYAAFVYALEGTVVRIIARDKVSKEVLGDYVVENK